jgi:hypothetical protein
VLHHADGVPFGGCVTPARRPRTIDSR